MITWILTTYYMYHGACAPGYPVFEDYPHNG